MLAPRKHARDVAPISTVPDPPDGRLIPSGTLSAWLRIGVLVWLVQSLFIFILALLLLVLGQ